MAKTKIRRVVSAVHNLGGRTGLTKAEIADYLRAYYGGSTPVELTRSLRAAVDEGFLSSKYHRYFPATFNQFNDTDIIELRRRRRGGRRRRSRSRRGSRRRSRRGRRHDDDDVDAIGRKRRTKRARRGRRHDDDDFVNARRRRRSGRPRRTRRHRRTRGRRHATEQPVVQNLEVQSPPQQAQEPQVPQ